MNVLVFFTDQQQRRTTGAYGNDVVRTPNLDRLAERGTVFENGVCAQPVCTPSRCSLFSGVYPHTHGIVDNYHALPRRWPTLAEMVIDRGVRTGYLGKWHMGNEVLPQRGFEEFYRAIDDTYTNGRDFPLYGLSGYSRWLIDRGYEPDGEQRPGAFSRVFRSHLPKEHSGPAFIAEEAERFLEARKDETFFLVCSFLEPHNPYHSAYDDLHDPAEIELPPNFHTEPLDGWPARNAVFQRWARTVAHADETEFDSEAKWRDVIARYYGACHLVDEYVGRVLAKLRELGLDDDTLIVFTSDHGDMMGSHGIYMKSMMFEESQGVPLLVRAPGARPGRIREPQSNVDVAATILDALGVEAPEHVQGESFLPLLRGEREEDGERPVVCEWNGIVQKMFSKLSMFDDVEGMFIRSIRSGRWKLNVNVGDRWELYDLEADPYEMRNRIGDGECAGVVEDLYAKLRAWRERTDDPLQLPERPGFS